MSAPSPSKLAELREAIGRIPAFVEDRKSFTPAQRRAVHAAYDGFCGACDEPVEGRKWEVDHILPRALGGAHEPSNWMLLHAKPCHADKTVIDRRRIDKAKRQAKMDLPREEPSRFQSRPFPTSTRKLEGRGFDKRRKVNA